MTWLTNQFLVAMPTLGDSLFERTVVLVCMHDEDGALGIVVNRKTELLLDDIFKELDLNAADKSESELPVYFGGPCQIERGLVLHNSGENWASTIPIGNQFALTMSRDVLEAISEQRGPAWYMPLLGFSGWETDQLESEIRDNLWLSAPADHSIIFNTPVDERWQRAAALVGIEIETMSPVAGNA